jgi:DNA-binding CsgD family transcriptional regulator
MNPFALISAFLALLSLILGIYILYLDPKKLIHRLFFLMMILYAYWEFILIGLHSTENKDTFIFWYKMTSISFVFVPITLNIIMLIVRLRRKIMIPVLSVFYSMYLFFLYQNINLNLIYKDFVKVGGNWILIRTDPQFITVFYMTTFGLILIITMILIINWYRKTNFLREKKQTLVLLLSLALLVTFTFIDYVIFYFTNRDLGIFAHYICIWPIGIGISIIKYRFLSFSPGLFSHEVFENIEESVLVLDCNKKIIFANSSARKLFPDDARESDLRKSIFEYDKIIAKIDELFKGVMNNIVENMVSVNDADSKIVIRAKFSIIKDKYNDRIGVLVLCQELKGMGEFTAEYKVTGRELDVIRYVTTGLPNREIADIFNISERTIESHMVNIYNKLNIKNKVELINVLKKYDLA